MKKLIAEYRESKNIAEKNNTLCFLKFSGKISKFYDFKIFLSDLCV
ncbi:MAG: hypothetical protein ABH869_02945 [Candidatus Omnitrophota bacterium]